MDDTTSIEYNPRYQLLVVEFEDSEGHTFREALTARCLVSDCHELGSETFAGTCDVFETADKRIVVVSPTNTEMDVYDCFPEFADGPYPAALINAVASALDIDYALELGI
jgi:hypothetical protein